MRHALLLALMLPACADSSDVSIRGEYVVGNFDSVLIDTTDSNSGYGGVVLDISALDDGLVVDDGTFHSPSANGEFELAVPRGAVDVHLIFHQHTFDGNDRTTEAVVPGVMDTDADVGTVELP